MGEISNNSSSAGIDLSQFYQVFFEEAGENLESMEQKLLELNVDAADDEELNAIFRCAHSVKGGAATFGFSDVAAPVAPPAVTSPTLKSMPVPKAQTRAIELVVGPLDKPETADALSELF